MLKSSKTYYTIEIASRYSIETERILKEELEQDKLYLLSQRFDTLKELEDALMAVNPSGKVFSPKSLHLIIHTCVDKES
jgi:hypothetical protein